MSYTKAELTAQVLDRVQNRVNLDNTTKRHFVAKYLTAAINKTITGQYYLDKQSGAAGISGAFLATYDSVPVKKNETRNLRYVDLPAKLVHLPNEAGIGYAGPQQGEQNALRLISQKDMALSGSVLKHSQKIFALLEGNRVYFVSGLPNSTDAVMVKMVADIDKIGEDEQLPIPAGMEADVINMCVEFFLGKRQLPEDTINDNKDLP